MYSPFEGTKTEQLFRKINTGRVVAPHRKFNSWQQICSKTDKSIKQSPEFQHDHSKHPRKTGLHHFQQLCSSPTSSAIEKPQWAMEENWMVIIHYQKRLKHHCKKLEMQRAVLIINLPGQNLQLGMERVRQREETSKHHWEVALSSPFMWEWKLGCFRGTGTKHCYSIHPHSSKIKTCFALAEQI